MSFDNLLEELIEFTERCYPHFFSREKKEKGEKNQAKEEMHRAEPGSVPGLPSVSSPVQSGCVTLPAPTRGNMQVSSTRRFTQALVSRVFTGASLYACD